MDAFSVAIPDRMRRLSPVAVVFFLLFGCGTEHPEEPAASIATRDVREAEVIYSEAPAWTEETRWSLGPEPMLVIGPEFEPVGVLYRVRGVELLEDGRFVVANAGSRELLVFDERGTLAATWGGPGDGPGEFGGVEGLFTCGDGRLVVDQGPLLTFLDQQGLFTTQIRLPRPGLVALAGAGARMIGVASDCGSVFWWGQVSSEGAPNGAGAHGYPSFGFRVWLESGAVDSVGPFPGMEFLADPSGRLDALFPFSYQPNWAVHGGSFLYGWGDAPEVVVVSPEGSVSRIIRWAAPPARITAADWEEFDTDIQSAGFSADERSITAGRARHPRPGRRPYFGPVRRFDTAFRVDDSGYLWVRHSTRFLTRSPIPDSVRWSVFDPEGLWLGEVATPRGFDVHGIRNDMVLGVWTDEFGVEEVRIYRILGWED